MTLTPRLCAEVIRQRMGWPDGSQSARVINMIPQALKAFGRKYAADPFTRPLVTTNKATTSIAIGSRGAVNLVTGYDTYQFLLEYLDKGLIYFLPGVTASPYVLSGGTYASGYWTFNANPQHDETIAVNGVTFTFKYPSVIVAGGGSTAQNGTFDFVSILNGRPQYNGGDDGTYIRRPDDTWYTLNEVFEYVYAATSDAYFPYDVTGWEVSANGVAPVPTFTAGSLTSVQVAIGETLSETITNFVTVLNASVNASISVATYASSARRSRLTITYDTEGTGGNAFTLANSSFSSITRSGATLTGGAATAYALSIGAYTDYFEDLSRVQFTTTTTLPTGISALTNYYLTNYTIDDETATFNLSSTVDGLTPVVISSAGSGVLTMTLQEANDVPLQEISPQRAPLTQYLSDVFNYFMVQSTVLTLLPIDGEYPTGAVAFAVPSFPATLADLPASEEAEAAFLDKLFELVTGPGSDAAQDLEK